MIGDWRISLAFILVGICVAALHILRLRRESQDRQLWLQDMAERREERAERRKEREERRKRYGVPTNTREYIEHEGVRY